MADEGLPGVNANDDPTDAAGPPDPAFAAPDGAALDGANARPGGDRLLRDPDRPRRPGARVPWRGVRDARVHERATAFGGSRVRAGTNVAPGFRIGRAIRLAGAVGKRHAGRPVTRHAVTVAIGRPGPRRGGRHRELRPRRRHADREADRGHRRHRLHRRRQRLRGRLGAGVRELLRRRRGAGSRTAPGRPPATTTGSPRTPRAIATTSAPPRSTTPATRGTRTTWGRGT